MYISEIDRRFKALGLPYSVNSLEACTSVELWDICANKLLICLSNPNTSEIVTDDLIASILEMGAAIPDGVSPGNYIVFFSELIRLDYINTIQALPIDILSITNGGFSVISAVISYVDPTTSELGRYSIEQGWYNDLSLRITGWTLPMYAIFHGSPSWLDVFLSMGHSPLIPDDIIEEDALTLEKMVIQVPDITMDRMITSTKKIRLMEVLRKHGIILDIPASLMYA